MNKLAVATASAAGLGVVALAGALLVSTTAAPAPPPPAASTSSTPPETSSTAASGDPASPTPADAGPQDAPSPVLRSVSYLGSGGDVPAAVQALDVYFSSINDGDYPQVYAQLSPDQQSRVGDETSYAQGLRSTRDSDVVVGSISGDTGRATVSVTFTSQQEAGAGPDSESCTRWSVDYSMVPGTCTGQYCIDRVQDVDHRPC